MTDGYPNKVIRQMRLYAEPSEVHYAGAEGGPEAACAIKKDMRICQKLAGIQTDSVSMGRSLSSILCSMVPMEWKRGLENSMAV